MAFIQSDRIYPASRPQRYQKFENLTNIEMGKRKFETQSKAPAKTGRNEPALLKDDYLYRPFKDPKNQIRILVIKPAGKSGDPLIGHFSTRQLSPTLSPASQSQPKPDYDALSYSWGHNEKGGTIQIWDQSSDPKCRRLYQVQISQSLQICLRRLRNEDSDTYLWVDALCINQKDHDEKSDQVGAMGKIHRHAEQVRVWLGESDDDSDLAFSLIDIITDIDGIGRAIRRETYTRKWRAFGVLLRRKCTAPCSLVIGSC